MQRAHRFAQKRFTMRPKLLQNREILPVTAKNRPYKEVKEQHT